MMPAVRGTLQLASSEQHNACAGEEAAVKFFKPGTFHSLDEIEKVRRFTCPLAATVPCRPAGLELSTLGILSKGPADSAAQQPRPNARSSTTGMFGPDPQGLAVTASNILAVTAAPWNSAPRHVAHLPKMGATASPATAVTSP